MQATTKHKGIAREAPKPIPLGPRSRGWIVSELEDWVEQRRAERDAKAQQL
jgi:predicted DNA-binding transcriptional regulator AlpA